MKHRLDFNSVFYETQYPQCRLRDVCIKDASGASIFEMQNVVAPENWSDTAVNIAASKYFIKIPARTLDFGEGEFESEEIQEDSISDLCLRLSECWGDKLENIYGDNYCGIAWFIRGLLLNQVFAPNSPQWFNTGVFYHYEYAGQSSGFWHWDAQKGEAVPTTSAYEYPQVHACFIQSVEDSLIEEGGIWDLLHREARVFKYGSGTGTNFSNIRSEGESISCGGKSSGLMRFLKVFDAAAGSIKSGGKTRRAAKMVCLDLDHPEIMEFIQWKGKEEKKAQALIAAGYDSRFDGEAYYSVSGQNSNNSIQIPDAFFESEVWDLTSRTTCDVVKQIPTQDLWDAICQAAWECGDPGVQFVDTINAWHTCPQSGKIRASNPCSEYLFLDDTGCNLASINLLKFWDQDKKQFDTENFRKTVRLVISILDISIDIAQYPTREICEKTMEFRTLGLGYCNLGALVMSMGFAYDSDEARSVATCITAIMHAEAWITSSMLADLLGAFPGYEINRIDMQRVLKKSLETRYTDNIITPTHSLLKLHTDMKFALNEFAEVTHKPMRNAQVTCIAPTGTIGLLMDCDTTGIEPEFSLIKSKQLQGGGSFESDVSRSVRNGLETLGYVKEDADKIVNLMRAGVPLETIQFITPGDARVFQTAVSAYPQDTIAPEAHIRMVAAVQPFVSGGISKTINVPNHVTKDQIGELYMLAHRLGVKCVAIYRDGCKASQPLNVVNKSIYKCGDHCPGVFIQDGACSVCKVCGKTTGCA